MMGWGCFPEVTTEVFMEKTPSNPWEYGGNMVGIWEDYEVFSHIFLAYSAWHHDGLESLVRRRMARAGGDGAKNVRLAKAIGPS